MDEDRDTFRRPIATRNGLPDGGKVCTQPVMPRRLAVDRAEFLFRQFANPDKFELEVWATAIAAVLNDYSDEVILGVTDPRGGLARVQKWLPVIKEVVDECERRAITLAGQSKGDQARAETLRRRREDHADTPRDQREGFDELKKRHGDNWGIGKFDAVDRLRGDDDPAKQTEQKRVLSDFEIRKNRELIARMYDAEGVPQHEITSADPAWQMPVSPSLVKLLHGLDPRAPLSEPKKLKEIT
jgi:hypothetical protein